MLLCTSIRKGNALLQHKGTLYATQGRHSTASAAASFSLTLMVDLQIWRAQGWHVATSSKLIFGFVVSQHDSLVDSEFSGTTYKNMGDLLADVTAKKYISSWQLLITYISSGKRRALMSLTNLPPCLWGIVMGPICDSLIQVTITSDFEEKPHNMNQGEDPHCCRMGL